MIPKIIHYCWFGRKKKTEMAEKCIESWKKYCPDYTIIEWNEENFDVTSCAYVNKVYSEKKWAFVTDYVRLWVVYNYGGFYLDTDVELLRPLDDLRTHSLYFGCEGDNHVATGLGFGAEKENEFIKKNMEIYEEISNFESNGNFTVNPCPYYTTKLLREMGIVFPIKQPIKCKDIMIYPNEYFNPYDWASKKMKIKKNTYSIHHYSASWMSDMQKKSVIERHNYEKIKKKYGEFVAKVYSYSFWSKKENGGKGLIKQLYIKLKQLR